MGDERRQRPAGEEAPAARDVLAEQVRRGADALQLPARGERQDGQRSEELRGRLRRLVDDDEADAEVRRGACSARLGRDPSRRVPARAGADAAQRRAKKAYAAAMADVRTT